MSADRSENRFRRRARAAATLQPPLGAARIAHARAGDRHRGRAVAALAAFPQDQQSAQPARPVRGDRHRVDRHDLRHPDRRHRPLGRLAGRPHGRHPRPFAASLPDSDRDRARRAFGGGNRPRFGAADRLFRPRRLRDHARRHGDRQEPRLHLLGPDLDQRHPSRNSTTSSTRPFLACRRMSGRCSCSTRSPGAT